MGIAQIKEYANYPAIPAVLDKSGCKGIDLKAFRKPLKAMDGFRERQDGFMRVCEKLLGQSPCWHSLFRREWLQIILENVYSYCLVLRFFQCIE
jgi:hypothetical protein